MAEKTTKTTKKAAPTKGTKKTQAKKPASKTAASKKTPPRKPAAKKKPDSGKRYKIAQVAKAENVTERTIQNWTDEKLKNHGWIRIKDGSRVFFYQDNGSAPAKKDNMSALERRDKEVSIQIKEQKLEKNQRLIELNYEDDILEVVYKFVTGIRNGLQKCKLSNEQTILLQKEITESLESVKKSLNM